MGAHDLDEVRRVCRFCRGTGLRPYTDGEKMRMRRQKARLSLRTVAKRLGISHVTLLEKEKSVKPWSLRMRVRYARAVSTR